MARSRVELFEQIRKDRRVAGSSIRELAGRHQVHRRTVRQALDSAVPPPRKSYPQRPRPAIDAYAAVIDGWLVADRQVPRKQRHTARRVWQRLVAEHGATVSEVTVSRYVARRRTELGLDRVEVAVPQAHLPGAEAEVDFGEFYASTAGTMLKLWMFVLRLSCSGRAFHVAFATQAQEARQLYEQYHVAGSGIPIFQAAFANINPRTEAKVDKKNPDRGPMLIIGGEKDHQVSWAIANATYKEQSENPGVTEIADIPNRGHSLTIDSGWQEVAQTCLSFIRRFV